MSKEGVDAFLERLYLEPKFRDKWFAPGADKDKLMKGYDLTEDEKTALKKIKEEDIAIESTFTANEIIITKLVI